MLRERETRDVVVEGLSVEREVYHKKIEIS